MLVERALTEDDIPLLATIDRTELIPACYRMDCGELVLYATHHDMRGWPEGEAEQDAVALRACLQREAALQRPGGATGAYIDDTADRVAAPQDGLRATQNFNPIDVIEQEVGKSVTTRRRRRASG